MTKVFLQISDDKKLIFSDLEVYLNHIESQLRESLNSVKPQFEKEEILKKWNKKIIDTISKFETIELEVKEVEKIEEFVPFEYLGETYNGSKNSKSSCSKHLRGEKIGKLSKDIYLSEPFYRIENFKKVVKGVFKITFKNPVIYLNHKNDEYLNYKQYVPEVVFTKFTKKRPSGIKIGDKMIFNLNIINYSKFSEGRYTRINFIEKIGILSISENNKSTSPKKKPKKVIKSQIKTNKNSNSNCFIVTTTMGDINHPVVNDFRNYRDEVLLNTILGRLFIKLYYQIGPSLSEIIKNNKTLFQISRSFILKLHKRIIKN